MQRWPLTCTRPSGALGCMTRRRCPLGQTVWPVLTAIRQWGDAWVVGKGRATVELLRRATAPSVRSRCRRRHRWGAAARSATEGKSGSPRLCVGPQPRVASVLLLGCPDGPGSELRNGGRGALEAVIGAVGDAVDRACRELGGNRCKRRSVLHNRPEPARNEGRNQACNDPAQIPDTVNATPLGFKSSRQPWRSFDPGPSGRSRGDPATPRRARPGPTQSLGEPQIHVVLGCTARTLGWMEPFAATTDPARSSPGTTV